jgi:hypothetical protein
MIFRLTVVFKDNSTMCREFKRQYPDLIECNGDTMIVNQQCGVNLSEVKYFTIEPKTN